MTIRVFSLVTDDNIALSPNGKHNHTYLVQFSPDGSEQDELGQAITPDKYLHALAEFLGYSVHKREIETVEDIRLSPANREYLVGLVGVGLYINAIKRLRAYTGASLKVAKAYVDIIRQEQAGR